MHEKPRITAAKANEISPDARKSDVAARREPSPEARRALAEAEARRRESKERATESAAREIGGREGPDPARYGDWEVNGIASDF
jgi:hypothetical protein